MKAIILAAGRGNRLKSVSEDTPKCMVEIGDKSLMHHQLTALKNNDVHEVVVVVGYQHSAVRDHALQISDIEFTFIQNPDYATTNTAYSLWLCREKMLDDFLYLNADVLFHPQLITRLLSSHHSNVLALDNKKCGAEEVKAIVHNQSVQHIGKKLDQARCFGEFIGIGRFSQETNDQFVRQLSRTVNDEMLVNEYFEYALDKLVKEVPFHFADISDIPCIEIDFPEDLRQAEEEIYPAITRWSHSNLS